MPPTGTTVADRYRLDQVIGRGGAGTVWRAFDEVLGRQVAVKSVPLPVAPDADEEAVARRRVLREARAAARLNHPGAVTVFDAVESDGMLHLVMELVDAPTLTQLVERDGPLDPHAAARLVLALVEPLTAAHAAGIVHRDVKPSNVLVRPGGTPKIGDFGIAALQDDSQVTRTGLIVGSPPFMAPEQAEGRPTSTATDVWGLGATLYFAVEGVAPFSKGHAVATLHAVVHDEPRPAERAGPLVPLLDDLLAKEPADRPSMSDLRLRLQEVLRPRPVVSPAATTVVDLRGEEPVVHGAPARPVGARRRSGPIAAAAALVAGVAVVGLALSGSDRDRDGPTPQASGAPTTTAPSPRSEVAAPATSQVPPTTSSVAAAVPRDWVRYTDASTGYRIAHPPGWQVARVDRTRTDFRKPSSSTYLRVDWVQPPGASPEGAWREYAPRFAAEHPGYREIRIESVDFRGWDAAIWEFTYPASGTTLHAVDLGFVVPGYGFALNFQTAERDWDAEQDTFESFKRAFQPPGSS